MPAFDLVVLGSGGGPSEDNLSAYLLKPHGCPWTEGILALEAGSGVGALRALLERDPHLFDDGTQAPANGSSSSSKPQHKRLYDLIRSYLISHAHLDHVNALILSAGSLSPLPSGRRRCVFGLRSVLDNLAGAFVGRLWPALASFNEPDAPHKLLLKPLPPDDAYHEVFPDIAVRPMPVAHGPGPDGDLSTYDSSAFFIRRQSTGSEFLFFGDVEPDALSCARTRTWRTRAVWRAAAPLIPHKLGAVFIECSWPEGRVDDELWGHLSPEHLLAELRALAAEVAATRDPTIILPALPDPTVPKSLPKSKDRGPLAKRRKLAHPRTPPPPPPAPPPPPPPPVECDVRGMLNGLRVYIIHCKDGPCDEDDRPMRDIITAQVKRLVDDAGLGAEILCAAQGMHITI